MSAYIIRATATGYELAIRTRIGEERVAVEEGGHGPIEKLFAQADIAWHEQRSIPNNIVARKAES